MFWDVLRKNLASPATVHPPPQLENALGCWCASAEVNLLACNPMLEPVGPLLTENTKHWTHKTLLTVKHIFRDSSVSTPNITKQYCGQELLKPSKSPLANHKADWPRHAIARPQHCAWSSHLVSLRPQAVWPHQMLWSILRRTNAFLFLTVYSDLDSRPRIGD